MCELRSEGTNNFGNLLNFNNCLRNTRMLPAVQNCFSIQNSYLVIGECTFVSIKACVDPYHSLWKLSAMLLTLICPIFLHVQHITQLIKSKYTYNIWMRRISNSIYLEIYFHTFFVITFAFSSSACRCVTCSINLSWWHLANSTKRSKQEVCKVLVF